jgi:glycosyltransferase involved in cell wall biosynthesis
MLWSILIAAIPERYHSAHKPLLSILEHQAVARMPDVELLLLLDNRRRSVGSKRNDLLSIANGEYVSFIDDDDEVATDYVQRIYRTIVQTRKSEAPADVICFPQRCTLQPHNVIHDCTYSLAYWKDREPAQRRQLAPSDKPNTLNWTGPPAHTMVWRRAVLEGIKFPEKTFGEDVDFVDQACEKAKTEVQIVGGPLYLYRFDEAKSRTRG